MHTLSGRVALDGEGAASADAWAGAGQSGSVSPNSPVSFEDLANVRVNHLPYGWKDQLEVIEAHYVKEIFDQIAR